MKKIGNATLYCADCRDVLPLLKDIDSCVTDPPYGLSFMGKAWDYDVPDVEIWTEIFKTLKTGAHLLSFFGSRTYHRGAIPIEDAGFEIRDQLMWLYGSGFPKSHNIGKAVDKLKGNEREVVESNNRIASSLGNKINMDGGLAQKDYKYTKGKSKYEGWGTALKPAHEPIVMARKPFKGSVANNVLEHGTGGINIDECRVETNPNIDDMLKKVERKQRVSETWEKGSGFKNEDNSLTGVRTEGRFPANVMHDGSQVVEGIFPETNSRYFYCAKTSKKDRDEGLDAFNVSQATGGGGGIGDYLDDVNSASGKFGSEKAPAKNTHPTVKPVELMKYLCRLVTPKGGVVVDPFMGSGSTGKACMVENFSFIGIEKDEAYFEIACARIEAEYKKRKQDLFYDY